jgi:hypothetical protein
MKSLSLDGIEGSDDTYHVYKPDAQEILHNGVSVAPLP